MLDRPYKQFSRLFSQKFPRLAAEKLRWVQKGRLPVSTDLFSAALCIILHAARPFSLGIVVIPSWILVLPRIRDPLDQLPKHVMKALVFPQITLKTQVPLALVSIVCISGRGSSAKIDPIRKVTMFYTLPLPLVVLGRKAETAYCYKKHSSWFLTWKEKLVFR